MAVKVQFEIGHTSKLRSKRTVDGFTHDWELYVRGVQQADISVFVEKIIFRLHESFQNHNRVFKEPPYNVQESGYAGFIVFIDIYFRNRDEPKKVQYSYDLDLLNTGPPHSRSEIKTFIFDNPSEEFRQKLLKGGGVPVSGVVGGQTTAMNNNTNSIPIGASLNHSPGESHKNLVPDGKKHKSRPEDLRSNSFANLFGPPITKTTTGITTALTKHSPENKTLGASTNHQNSLSSGMPIVKEKSSKDRDKSSEKSRERSSKKEKHHKQSLTSPHKEGRSESKKSESSKHEKRDKNEEKPKKDKIREKDKEREREKNSSSNVNHNTSNNKRPSSPKATREHSPHKTASSNNMAAIALSSNANSIPRPSSSNSGKIEDVKVPSKPSKDTAGESKSKDSKLKESSSSSSGKKSKKEKKDKDKDKERDKERRHEEKEKQKLNENQQRSAAKEDTKAINSSTTNPNNSNSTEHKNSKAVSNTNVITNVAHNNDGAKKSDKITKQDLFKSSEKPIVTNAPSASLVTPANNTSHSALNDKKSSSVSSLNSNSNPPEKDKRSHKHKKKEKNKDKDKDRERDKEREKDKEKERDKDKEREKEKDTKKEKEAKEKHHEEKSSDGIHTAQTAKATLTPSVCTNEEPIINANSSSSSTVSAMSIPPPMPTTTSANSLSSTSRSSKNKEKKSKDKSSSKEEKLKHKSSEVDTGESKSKQPKLSTSNSLSASSSSSASTPITNPSTAIKPLTVVATVPASENNMSLDLSDTDSLPPASSEVKRKPALTTAHSDSSNSSFPDLPLPKQQPVAKTSTAAHELVKPAINPTPIAVVATINSNASSKEPPKNVKSAKDKPQDKPSKEEEKDKKRRRNSVAVNTFIEPPLKQLKKEQTKSVREKSKSPSLRNTGSRASISAEASTTFLQPSASPSSTAAAAPLPPPSSAPSASHSPALSATEAVGNAASATANAATCNNNITPSSTINSSASSVLAPHQLPLDYLSELQELHHKIMTLQDNDDLQHVVELIAATGCYEITTKTFDFDLCKLDRGTVQRLQEFFATSVS